MGVWAYGRMGVWAYGRMGVTGVSARRSSGELTPVRCFQIDEIRKIGLRNFRLRIVGALRRYGSPGSWILAPGSSLITDLLITDYFRAKSHDDERQLRV